MRIWIKTAIVILSLSAVSVFAADAGPSPGVQTCSDSESCLRAIVQNTYGALEQINKIPDYLKKITDMAVSWLQEDDSQTTADIQKNFADYGNSIVQNIQAQEGLQRQIMADVVNQPLSNFTTPPDKPEILKMLPNVNDLSYSTLIGKPPVPKAPGSPYGYLRMASGIGINHITPNYNWSGRRDNLLRYINYYNTVAAVTSFNGYVLSNQVIDAQNGNAFTALQNELISQASNSSWIAEIATEELGKVLRQMLMFQSQTYVLLSQLVQIEKQLLTAQVLNNTMLIVGNQTNESNMAARAQGQQPQP